VAERVGARLARQLHLAHEREAAEVKGVAGVGADADAPAAVLVLVHERHPKPVVVRPLPGLEGARPPGGPVESAILCIVTWDDGRLGNDILFYPGARQPRIGYRAVPGAVTLFRMKALRRGLLYYEFDALPRKLGGDPCWDHPLWANPGERSEKGAEWDETRAELGRAIRTCLP